MARAVADLGLRPDGALVDGNRAPDLPCPVETVVKGDGRYLTDVWTEEAVQFIQRRGRILRTAKGKSEAIIHDLIVVPYLDDPKNNLSVEEFNIERRILKRELARFKEFADAAENGFHILPAILDSFGLILGKAGLHKIHPAVQGRQQTFDAVGYRAYFQTQR